MNEKFFYDPYAHTGYWDCECEEDYINPKELKHCAYCGVSREDQPDSILEEVNRYYGVVGVVYE